MAVEKDIARGDAHLTKNELDDAIMVYSSIIETSPFTFQAVYQRAIAYSKSKDYSSAHKDIDNALEIATSRGKRELIGLCHFRKGVISFLENEIKQAVIALSKAEKYDCKEPTLSIWKIKATNKAKEMGIDVANLDDVVPPLSNSGEPTSSKLPGQSPSASQSKDISKSVSESVTEKASVPALAENLASTNISTINQHAPIKLKIRDDWCQSNSSITITIFAKEVEKQKVSISIKSKSFAISFPLESGSEYNYELDPLFAEVIPDESTYQVYRTKLEINLKKKDSIKWKALEGDDSTDTHVSSIQKITEENEPSALAYPTSSKKSINWSKFKVEDDEEEEQNDFFKSLYKGADEDTRRAMMKSYIESQGTSLSTDWQDVKSKTFEVVPPDGMVAKKY